MTRLQADLLLLLSAAIWGMALVFQKSAMDSVGPLTFIVARSVVAFTAIVPFALHEARSANSPVNLSFWRLALLGGGAFFAGAAFQQFGLLTATVTNASFLTALYAVFVPFLAWLILRRSPAPLVWVAAGISVIGTWLLGGAGFGELSDGDTLLAICAVFWALHLIVTGLASEHNRPFLYTMVQFLVVGALGLAGALVYETVSLAGLSAAWREIAYVGLVSSALTFSLLTFAMRFTPPAEAAIILSTENLFAALAGAMLLGERLQWINWSGAALIFAAVLLVQRASYGRVRAPSEGTRKES